MTLYDVDRLKAENAALKQEREAAKAGILDVQEEYAALEQERDRLRAENTHWQASCNAAIDVGDSLRAELGHARRLVETALRFLASDGDAAVTWPVGEDVLVSYLQGADRRAEAVCAASEAECARLRAELAALKEACRPFARAARHLYPNVVHDDNDIADALAEFAPEDDIPTTGDLRRLAALVPEE